MKGRTQKALIHSGTSVLVGTAICSRTTLLFQSWFSSRNFSKAKIFCGIPLIMSSRSTPSITYHISKEHKTIWRNNNIFNASKKSKIQSWKSYRGNNNVHEGGKGKQKIGMARGFRKVVTDEYLKLLKHTDRTKQNKRKISSSILSPREVVIS
jgi:hypothetical protein